jgi:hypothetical protein
VQREQELHQKNARSKSAERKQQKGLRILGVCALVCLFGLVRLIGYLASTGTPEFAELFDASVPLLLGIAGTGFSLVWVMRRPK